MSEIIEEMGSGAGNIVGFQIPLGMKQRKKGIDEMLAANPDVNEGHVLGYLNGMSEEKAAEAAKWLDDCDYEKFAGAVKDHAIREVVRKKIKEIVRKKAGGGGYVLYSPNQGKRRQAKAVGNFPTKLGAKKAELQRFPPRDPAKLKRLRHEVDRLLKDPKKRAEKEKEWSKQKGAEVKTKTKTKVGRPKRSKKEDVDRLRSMIADVITEGLFREESTGSDWDEYVARLSKQAVAADSKFQRHVKNIDKKTADVLQDSFQEIARSVDKKIVKLKNFGIKKEGETTYLAFSAVMDNVDVAPIFIHAEDGIPHIEVSDNAKAALTKVDPQNGKMFRAELVTVQERVLDKVQDLVAAVQARDKYLTKLQNDVDEFVSELTPLQLSLLKQLLVKKYRRIS